MIDVFKKINQGQPHTKQFSMPLSLEIITECGDYGITGWERLHFADLLSIIYGKRIRNAQRYLDEQYQSKLKQRGIASVTKATTKDFDNL